MKLSRDVVLIDYLRSPFSRSRPKEPEKDLLNGYRMDEVLAQLWRELLKRNNLNPLEIEEAVTGTAAPVQENFTLGGRFPVLLAELPVSVASHQTDMQCGSSLEGLRHGVMSIASGFADAILLGGIEHMTHVPIDDTSSVKMPEKLFTEERYKKYQMRTAVMMGLWAQKLQEKAGLSREDMDKFAVRSHQFSAKAQKEGFFKDEILPIKVFLPDGREQIYDYDANIRPDTSLEALASMKPAYRPDGTITAGNSSPLTTGATAMLIMSREKADKLGLRPKASFVTFGVSGVEPSMV